MAVAGHSRGRCICSAGTTVTKCGQQAVLLKQPQAVCKAVGNRRPVYTAFCDNFTHKTGHLILDLMPFLYLSYGRAGPSRIGTGTIVTCSMGISGHEFLRCEWNMTELGSCLFADLWAWLGPVITRSNMTRYYKHHRDEQRTNIEFGVRFNIA